MAQRDFYSRRASTDTVAGIREAAKVLDINPHTLRAMLQAGEAPGRRTSAGWVISREVVAGYGIRPGPPAAQTLPHVR